MDYDLSEVSRLSLARQGAAMTPSEAPAFRVNPLAPAAIALRRADEAAKVAGLAVPGLDAWAPRLCAYAATLQYPGLPITALPGGPCQPR